MGYLPAPCACCLSSSLNSPCLSSRKQPSSRADPFALCFSRSLLLPWLSRSTVASFRFVITSIPLLSMLSFSKLLRWVSKSLLPLIRRWAEESIAVQKNVLGVVQDFVGAPKFFVYVNFLSLPTMASDVGGFIYHGDGRSLSSYETQNLSRSLVRPHNFRSEPSTQMWVQTVLIKTDSNLTYGKIFGFKHNMKNNEIEYDPSEQSAVRTRLFARVIHVIGVLQIPDLQPLLRAKLEKTSIEEIDSQSMVDGMSPSTPVIFRSTH